MKACCKSLGNITIPGATFLCGLTREPRTSREQYVLQVSTRWGVAFEIALYNRDQMTGAMSGGSEADAEAAFSQNFLPDAYELLNVYKLYD